MRKWLKILGQSLTCSSILLISCLGLALAETDIVEVDTAKITTIKRQDDKRVQRHPGDPNLGKEHWRPAQLRDILLNKNWLATGTDAEANFIANLYYFSQNLIYRQQEDSLSQFYPDPSVECGFKLTSGSNALFSDKNPEKCKLVAGRTDVELPYKEYKESDLKSSVESGGELAVEESITLASKNLLMTYQSQDSNDSEAEDSVVALYVFRNQEAQETIVGVLASQLGAVTVRNPNTQEKEIQLTAGQFAFVSDDGRLVRGEFSLRNFYENNPLGAGLSDSDRDEEYAEGLEGEKKKLFDKIREATIEALNEQSEPGPFEIRVVNPPSIPVTIIDPPSPPECYAIDPQLRESESGLICF